jgi:N-acetyl sugar amidotransferase
MRYCTNCVYPDTHPLGITFNAEGICSGCIVHREKYEIDWSVEKNNLLHLIESQQKNAHPNYDCIIPVVGSGDDFFVVHYVKKILGMNPLLVSYNSHFSTKVGIRNLARLISQLDCEHINLTVGPDTVKEIVRTTLFSRGDIFWHIQAGLQSFATQVAVKLGIPLIIWGVNGWMDQVGKFSHYHKAEMSEKIWHEFSLRKLSCLELLRLNPNLSEKDVTPFVYPNRTEIASINVRGVYLNNYIFWDSKKQIEEMINLYGFETRQEQRTFNSYETAHCWINSDLQDYLKLMKYGYSKVYDHAARDLRLGRLNRDEAIQLVKYYEDRVPLSLDAFCDWLDISVIDCKNLIKKCRSNRVWRRDGKKWVKKRNLLDTSKNQKLIGSGCEMIAKNCYRITTNLEPEDPERSFLLMGRTYMDQRNYQAVEG